MIVDFHTHAFPDALAERAMRTLLAETDEVKAHLDGRLSSLLKSMDSAGIEQAVVCSIATRPEQFDKILEWSLAVNGQRVIPFPSVHPRDPDAREHIARVAGEGFKGLKLHPYYQDFDLTADFMWPFYERVQEAGLLLVCHTGFDVAFERVRIADPRRVARVLDRCPGLRFVTTHMGAWQDWAEVDRHLLGREVYIETSYSIGMGILPDDRARAMLNSHPADRLLFGTDSPWQDQAISIERLRALDLEPEREQAILGDNARSLLGL